MAYSPDGKTLASGGEDRTIRVWDPATGQTTTTITSQSDTVWSMAFSPDGSTIASGNHDHQVRLWHLG